LDGKPLYLATLHTELAFFFLHHRQGPMTAFIGAIRLILGTNFLSRLAFQPALFAA
jgi:hypothetical protein